MGADHDPSPASGQGMPLGDTSTSMGTAGSAPASKSKYESSSTSMSTSMSVSVPASVLAPTSGSASASASASVSTSASASVSMASTSTSTPLPKHATAKPISMASTALVLHPTKALTDPPTDVPSQPQAEFGDRELTPEQRLSEAERLQQLNIMHSLLLSPEQDHVIIGHLARVHASGRRSRLLDVGTGTGTWAISVATRHPFADVVGIDIDWGAFQAARLHPQVNNDFYTVDVLQPLPWPDNSFDLIHVKSMLMDVPQYPDLIGKLARVLRPGGMLILVETELRFHCIEGTPSATVTSFSEALKSALASRDTDIDLPANLDKPIEDTGQFSAQFYFQEIGCPIGPYVPGTTCTPQIFLTPGSRTLAAVGNIQKALLYTSLDRLICRRIEPGPERTHLESLMKDCARDLRSPTARYLQRLFAVYAYKKVLQ